MFGALDGFGFEFSDEGVPPPDRSEAEELEEQVREDAGLGDEYFDFNSGPGMTREDLGGDEAWSDGYDDA